MDKREFTNEVVEKLRAMYPEREFTVKEVDKNGTKMLGITVDMPELTIDGAAGISPVYYPEPYYGHKKPIEVAEKFAENIDELLEKVSPMIDINKIPDFKKFEELKDKIFPVLTSTANPEYLKPLVSKSFEDLAITYKIALSPDASIRITNDILKSMNVSIEDIHKAALENLAKEPIKPKSMTEIMAEMMGQKLPEAEVIEDKMYVLTNTTKIHGAMELLNTKVLDDFAKEHGWKNVVILPSSIHEVLLLKDTGDYKDLLSMVKEVNRTQVAPEDRLSDNVYVYDSEKGRLQGIFNENHDLTNEQENEIEEPDR